MQSIYGWRQAEVALFERARISGIGRWALEPDDLTVNFRSQQRLVGWFNATFPHILTHLDDATGAVPYHRAEAHEPAGAAPVEIHPRLDRDADAEAAQAVALIEQALGETEQGTVAVLVRARTHLPEIARALRQRGIRFRAVKTDPLGERQAVRDVDALARALLDLSDRAAWLAILRAPWCGLDLPDLAALCESDHQAAIWELLQTRGNTLSAPARARLARVVPVLGDALSARGRVPLRLLVESAWLSLGGLAALPPGEDGASGRRDVEAYLDLLADVAEAEEMPEPRRVDSMLADLFAPTDTSAGIRVEMMTIHTAKGLEFDTVLVPGLGRGKRRDEPRLLYWQEKKTATDGDQLLLGALEPVGSAGPKENTVEGYLRQLQHDRTAEEEKRLFYVAATRARRRLHLLGHVPVPKKDDAAIKPFPGSLLAILWEVPEIRAAFEALPRPAARTQETPEPDEPAAVLLHRLPLEWAIEAPPAPFPWQSSPAGGATETPHTFDWAGDRLRRIGTVTHALLHRIAREGVATWNEATLASRTPAVRAALQGAGISPEDLEASTARVVAALGNVLHGERGRWLLTAHDQARSEYEITAVLNGEVRRLKIDRTFVEDGVRWIVDYKVADREGGDREGFLLAQMEKYRPDLERYRAALEKIESRPARLALYIPLLNEFRELTELSIAADAT